MASLVALMAPNIRFNRRITRSPFLRAASCSKLSSANEMFADTRSSIETSLPVDRVRLAPRNEQHADALAVAGQRQRCRRAHLVGLGALAPGQRARIVQEIVADAYLPVAKGLPGRPRTPRAYRPRSKCRCCAGEERRRHSRRRSAADWFPAPAGRSPRPGSRRPRTRLRRPSRTVLRVIWRTESLRWSHSTPRTSARYRSSPSPSSLPAAPGCPRRILCVREA